MCIEHKQVDKSTVVGVVWVLVGRSYVIIDVVGLNGLYMMYNYHSETDLLRPQVQAVQRD